jgi:Na+-transporting NADH:ubiquinone oxidoreductase subunit NqrB
VERRLDPHANVAAGAGAGAVVGIDVEIAIGAWRDARLFQIAFLATLLTVGVLARDFALLPLQMALAFAAGIATQAIWIDALGIKQRGVLSAVITCFGLSILLRADSLWVHPLAAALAISAKFVIRFRGKHLYNPANLGVILAISLFPGAWVSPGQWGQDVALAAWFVVLGGLVVNRARRSDIAWMFLAAYLGLVALRVVALGQPWTIWLHQLANGGLLLFAFFMISDPMTIPNRRNARAAYAIIVAIAAFLWHYALFKPNGLVWALFFCTPLVPLIDWLWPAPKFEWRREQRGPKGDEQLRVDARGRHADATNQ